MFSSQVSPNCLKLIMNMSSDWVCQDVCLDVVSVHRHMVANPVRNKKQDIYSLIINLAFGATQRQICNHK